MSKIRFNPLNPRHQCSYFFYAKQNYKSENISRKGRKDRKENKRSQSSVDKLHKGISRKARKENTRKGRKENKRSQSLVDKGAAIVAP